MNEIVNKFLSAGYKFILLYKFKETGDLTHIYQIELDKSCF